MVYMGSNNRVADNPNRTLIRKLALEDLPLLNLLANNGKVKCRCGQLYDSPEELSLHQAISGHWAKRTVTRKDKHNV
jgi:hypothetical protein